MNWKTEAVAQAMVGRFFVWIDDEITEADVDYLARRHPAGSVLYWVDPAVGLLPRDFRRIAALAEGTRRGFLAGQPAGARSRPAAEPSRPAVGVDRLTRPVRDPNGPARTR